MPKGARWWEHLDPDFYQQPEPFQLALRDRLQVRATAASDVLIRTVGACLVGSTAIPLGYGRKRLQAAMDDRAFYGPMAESGDPSRFFRAPPKSVHVRTKRARFSRFRPVGGGVTEDLSFESPFIPCNPRERDRYLRHRANRIAHMRHWRHEDGPRPTIIAIHGFSADLALINEWFFALPWLYHMGFNVALFTLPFHGRRQTRFSPFSGHGFFAGGINHINEAFGQAVHDFRAFMDHLEQLGTDQVGVMGVSLGGFTTALLAAIEPRLKFVIPNVPVTSVADLVHEWEPIGTVVRAAFKRLDIGIESARHMLAVSCPLTYAPVVDRERLFVIGGVGDRLAPPKHSRLLWDHWGRCQIHWFPGSHLVHLDRGTYLRQVARFLREIGFYDHLPPPSRR